MPTGKLRRALNQTRRLWTELRADEQRHRITQSREPEDGFVAAIYRWATTGDLTTALAASDASGTRDAVVGGRFRAVVPSGPRPARPGAQCRTRRRRCAPPRNALSTTFDAASWLLMPGSVFASSVTREQGET